MITNIYLIRHAESIYSKDELNRPITEKGEIDSKDLNEQFRNIEVDMIFSSPYKRSIQTLESLADNKNLKIEIVDDFKERKKWSEEKNNFLESMAKLWTDENFAYDGGESNRMGKARAIKALNKILDSNQGENVVIGSHGDLMALMLNYYDKSYSFEFWRNLDMPDVYKLEFEGRHMKCVERIWVR